MSQVNPQNTWHQFQQQSYVMLTLNTSWYTILRVTLLVHLQHQWSSQHYGYWCRMVGIVYLAPVATPEQGRSV